MMKHSGVTQSSVPVWLDAQEPLTRWYSSRLGQCVAAGLQQQLRSRMGDVFGYQGLQVGNPVPGLHLLQEAGLQRRLVLDAPNSSEEVCTTADIYGDVVSLPVASGSMKAVAFFHTLDFCDHPHQALREANRVLTDDGQLIVVGFNPFSIFGARHALTGWRRREPWNGRFYPRHRISDWLSVLDYHVLDSSSFFMRPPINSERVLRRLERMESLNRWLSGVGGVYVMRARKQTIPMTLVRPWQVRRRSSLTASSFARSGDATSARPRATVARIDSRQRS